VNEIASRSADAHSSATYPQRVHIHERSQWQALLKKWDERVASAGQTLTTLSPGDDRTARQLLYLQMTGARDQIADAVRRLPMEVGSMYEDDHLRLEEGVAALERLFQHWGTASQ
jgi:hypothetical protein